MKKAFRKTVAIFMVGAVISAIPLAAYSQPLDGAAPSAWAVVEIERAREIGLLTGGVQLDYRGSITREEFSELAVRLYEVLGGRDPAGNAGNPFYDTQNTAVIKAASLGIVNGKGDGRFDPYGTATREEVTVMLYRALQASRPGQDFSQFQGYAFSDRQNISPWALEAVSRLSGMGIIKGVGNNCFNPGRNMSREEAIALARRLYEEVKSPGSLTASRSRRAQLADELRALIPKEMGKPYQWGAAGPDSFDCSGLVYYLYGKLGISLPRVAASQAGAGTYVSKSDLEYGDLVFFAIDGKNINHVGIYVGNGEFVHAPSTGDVVKKSTLLSGYYERTYYTARRVF